MVLWGSGDLHVGIHQLLRVRLDHLFQTGATLGGPYDSAGEVTVAEDRHSDGDVLAVGLRPCITRLAGLGAGSLGQFSRLPRILVPLWVIELQPPLEHGRGVW